MQSAWSGSENQMVICDYPVCFDTVGLPDIDSE
jgi:hypothetical protein